MEIELRNKIAEAMKNEFVGNYIFSSKELETIYDEAGRKLKNVGAEWGSNLSVLDYDLIFVALVNITKDWNSDEEAFFDYVYRRLLGNSGTGKVYTQIVKVINSLHDCGKIFTIDSFTKKYYAAVISHAFAPIGSIESLFEMCWEIYCEDLQQQYSKNDSAFKLIVDSLYNKFSKLAGKEDLDFQIGSQVYAFRAGIKGLILDKKQQLIDLLDIVTESIHLLFNESPLTQDSYIKVLINNWWKKKETTFGIVKQRNFTKRDFIASDYSQIRPKFILEEADAKLLIPAFRLLDHFDDAPIIQIKNGDTIVTEQSALIHGSGILMSTKPMTFLLSDFDISDINITILHGNKIIFGSNDSLKRDYILFKESKEITMQDCFPGIYFLYTNNIDELLQYPEDIHSIGRNTYSFESYEGEILQSKKKTTFFVTEKSNREIYFFANQYGDAIYRFDGEDYKVIDGELYVDVADNTDLKQFGIKYDETTFHLTDFELIGEVNQHRRYCISSLLNVGEPQKINVFRYGDNSILGSINLIKFNNIRLSFDKELYYGKNQTGEALFVTEKYHLEQSFDIKETEVSFTLGNGEIVVKPPVLRWKIDDGNWHSEISEKGMWYKQITNSSILSIDIPKRMNCIVGLNNVAILEQGANNCEFKLGQSIYAYKDTNTSLKFFTVFIKASNEEFYAFADIYFKENFIAEPIYIFSNSKDLYWLPECFIGDADSDLHLDLIQKEKTVESIALSNKKTKISFAAFPDGYYQIKIRLIGKGFLKQEKVLFEKSIVLGNEKDLKYRDKSLCITKMVLFDKIEPETVKPIYIDHIKYLGIKDNFDCYSGNLYVIGQYGNKVYLNQMVNNHGLTVKINPIRIDLKSDTSCYIGYGLDVYDSDYEYDDEFTLSSNGRTTIGHTYCGETTRNIDFYKFEVKDNV